MSSLHWLGSIGRPSQEDGAYFQQGLCSALATYSQPGIILSGLHDRWVIPTLQALVPRVAWAPGILRNTPLGSG
jgi:hypothetical protein